MNLQKGTTILICALILASFAGCSNTKDYETNSRAAQDLMKLYEADLIKQAEEYQGIWGAAISSGYKDFNTEINAHKMMLVAEKRDVTDDPRKARIDSLVKSLADVPSGSEQLHGKIAELYGHLNQIYELAKFPRGNFNSYTSEIREMASGFERLCSEADAYYKH
ncbi:MAG: hypothetical protein HY962_07030 [Ignavibacteriae bacterium]|nr:hypothetical protein [Ignavibacteriota bacterium]